MSDLDNSLAKLSQFVEKYPNASVWVKFPNSVNYRHFPSDPVTNDSFATLTTVALSRAMKFKLGATPLRQF